MKELISYLKSLIVEAGELLLSQTVSVSKHKTANDLLTENDLLIERFLIDGVKGKFPSVNIVSEETAADNALQGVSVVIDPIDGTCNYAVGTDRFGVQAAVFDAFAHQLGTLRINLAAAQSVVTYLGVAHILIGGQTDGGTMGLQISMGAGGQQIVQSGSVCDHNSVAAAAVALAHTVHDHKYDRFFHDCFPPFYVA